MIYQFNNNTVEEKEQERRRKNEKKKPLAQSVLAYNRLKTPTGAPSPVVRFDTVASQPVQRKLDKCRKTEIYTENIGGCHEKSI